MTYRLAGIGWRFQAWVWIGISWKIVDSELWLGLDALKSGIRMWLALTEARVPIDCSIGTRLVHLCRGGSTGFLESLLDHNKDYFPLFFLPKHCFNFLQLSFLQRRWLANEKLKWHRLLFALLRVLGCWG